MSNWAGTPEQEIETLREMVEQRDAEIERLSESDAGRQAEALEAHAESIRKWAEHTNLNFMFAHGALAAANQADKYAQQLRDGVDDE